MWKRAWGGLACKCLEFFSLCPGTDAVGVARRGWARNTMPACRCGVRWGIGKCDAVFAFADFWSVLGSTAGLLAYLGFFLYPVAVNAGEGGMAWLQGTQGTNQPLGPSLPPACSVVPAWSRVQLSGTASHRITSLHSNCTCNCTCTYTCTLTSHSHSTASHSTTLAHRIEELQAPSRRDFHLVWILPESEARFQTARPRQQGRWDRANPACHLLLPPPGPGRYLLPRQTPGDHSCEAQVSWAGLHWPASGWSGLGWAGLCRSVRDALWDAVVAPLRSQSLRHACITAAAARHLRRCCQVGSTESSAIDVGVMGSAAWHGSVGRNSTLCGAVIVEMRPL